MTGVVNHRLEATIRLTLTGAISRTMTVEAIIDSGFNGSLMLPMPLIEQLQLVAVAAGGATLADGSSQPFYCYLAQIEWFGQMRPVYVSALGTAILIGTDLLRDLHLEVDFRPKGNVSIGPIAG